MLCAMQTLSSALISTYVPVRPNMPRPFVQACPHGFYSIQHLRGWGPLLISWATVDTRICSLHLLC